MVFIAISLFKGNWMLAIGGGVAYYLYFKLVVQGLLGVWSNREKSSEKIAEPSEMPQEEKIRIDHEQVRALRILEGNDREPIYRAGAEKGEAWAQFNLGEAYSYGVIVAEDKKEGVKWYRMAANQGHVKAQHNLGLMYANGQGVPQDFKEAAKWYRKAADQGVAEAQQNLGAYVLHKRLRRPPGHQRGVQVVRESRPSKET
jgi:TPR repeat protein